MMNLVDAMQIKYGAAKRWQRYALLCAVAVLLAGLAARWSALTARAGWIAAGVFILQVAGFLLKQAAAHRAGEGEQIRRMAMLKDGLGVDPPKTRVAQVQLSIDGAKASEPAYVGPYYDSEFAIGPRRLIDITTECAFFTGGNRTSRQTGCSRHQASAFQSARPECICVSDTVMPNRQQSTRRR